MDTRTRATSHVYLLLATVGSSLKHSPFTKFGVSQEDGCKWIILSLSTLVLYFFWVKGKLSDLFRDLVKCRLIRGKSELATDLPFYVDFCLNFMVARDRGNCPRLGDMKAGLTGQVIGCGCGGGRSSQFPRTDLLFPHQPHPVLRHGYSGVGSSVPTQGV